MSLPMSRVSFFGWARSIEILPASERVALPSIGVWALSDKRRVDPEPQCLGLPVLKSDRPRVGRNRRAFAALQFRHLAKIGGIAFAGRAVKFVGDQAARRHRRLRAAALGQADFIGGAMGGERHRPHPRARAVKPRSRRMRPRPISASYNRLPRRPARKRGSKNTAGRSIIATAGGRRKLARFKDRVQRLAPRYGQKKDIS